ncbi:MAG: thioredoxin fold domain-containing protein [Planctomycetes bacterium]|nr:thioredoxin fold domain-containing protein [Planctomycetota bacterium]
MVAQPVEGGILCLPSADVSVLRYDLCSDPRVLVLDHQCLDRKLGRRRRELRSTPAPREAVSVVPANPPTAPRLRRVDAAGFEREVLGNPLPVLVVFTAETCGPCHRVARVLEEAAEDYGGRLEFRNVDVLQEPALARAHAITFTPTMVVFDRGVPVGTRRVGAAPADRILRFVDRTLARGGAEPRTRG